MSHFERRPSRESNDTPNISISGGRIDNSSIGNTTNNYYGGYTESGDIINGGTVYKNCGFDYNGFEKRLEEIECVSSYEADTKSKAIILCKERNFEKLKALAGQFLMNTAASAAGGTLAALFQTMI